METIFGVKIEKKTASTVLIWNQQQNNFCLIQLKRKTTYLLYVLAFVFFVELLSISSRIVIEILGNYPNGAPIFWFQFSNRNDRWVPMSKKNKKGFHKKKFNYDHGNSANQRIFFLKKNCQSF